MDPRLTKDGDFEFDDLLQGTSFSQEYTISEELYQGFLYLFGDRSPLRHER